jgi:hypothetical protein
MLLEHLPKEIDLNCPSPERSRNIFGRFGEVMHLVLQDFSRVRRQRLGNRIVEENRAGKSNTNTSTTNSDPNVCAMPPRTRNERVRRNER